MHARRFTPALRWLAAFGALAAIVLVYRLWLHVNATTVALTLLLLILALAARWELRYAVGAAIAATILYNYCFLPPIGALTIADSQNWIALFAFLLTAILASRLSERARREAREARAGQRELDALFRLSRELLQTENPAALLDTLPAAVCAVTHAPATLLYLLDSGRTHYAGPPDAFPDAFPAALPHAFPDAAQLQHLAATLAVPTALPATGPHPDQTDPPVQTAPPILAIPFRSGVRPRGLLLLTGITLSPATAAAIGGLVAIAIDRAQALERIAHTEAARESERLRTLLLDSITHELRTPLTSIKGAATTLLHTSTHPAPIPSAQHHELLSIIDEECDRLNRLVSEAVDMAQLDARQLHMHFAPVSLAELVANARRRCAAAEAAHPITTHIPDGLTLRADPAVFEKVLCNLIENAAKYSRPGAPITLAAAPLPAAVTDTDSVTEPDPPRLTLSIQDQGSGIDPADQPFIFERFYRGRAHAESTPGTGMGLAICRSIVEAHNGTITVQSRPGHGSTFTLTLPRA